MKVTASPDRLIAFHSQVFCGLYDLRAAGEIELSFTREGFPRVMDRVAVVALRIEDPDTRRSINVAIDLIDGEHTASPVHHEWADVYFKSSHRPGAEGFDPEKYLPFGVRYACTSTSETLGDRVRFAYGAGRDEQNRVIDRKTWMRRIVSHPFYLIAGRHKATEIHSRIPPPVPFFEYPPDASTQDVVYYRTRVYPIDDNTGSQNVAAFEKVNDMRARTIRALRDAFGPAFLGGLRRSPYAEAHYPDIVIEEDADWRQHLRTVRTSLICVTTAGLFDSMDWKVAEYLAASRCMVSEQFKMNIPVPLEHGVHLMTFRTPDECVEHCASLLADRRRAQEMRQMGRNFYEEHVKPVSLMRNCLAAARTHSSRPLSVVDGRAVS